MITTGTFRIVGRINDAIIDVENSSFSCNKFRRPFPVRLWGATGGLIRGQTPFVCGGNDYTNQRTSRDCYKLNEVGRWTKDPTAVLNTARNYAGTGSVVMNNKLVLSGGHGYSLLKSIELASPNGRSKTLSVELPFGLRYHCSIQWDSDIFMVIGGSSDSRGISAETYFINVKTNTLKNGPSLNNARFAFACGEITVQGESYIAVSGGAGASISTEMLSKGNVAQGWQRGMYILEPS